MKKVNSLSETVKDLMFFIFILARKRDGSYSRQVSLGQSLHSNVYFYDIIGF